MTRLFGLAMVLGVWLSGCSDDKNYLYGSISEEFEMNLDFDEVEIRKETDNFVIRYRKDYSVFRCHYSNKNTVMGVTIQRIPAEAELKTWLDVKGAIKFESYVLTMPPLTCDENSLEQQSFPEKLTTTEASVIFNEVGQRSGESVEGQFRVRFGASTLNGGFQAKMQ